MGLGQDSASDDSDDGIAQPAAEATVEEAVQPGLMIDEATVDDRNETWSCNDSGEPNPFITDSQREQTLDDSHRGNRALDVSCSRMVTQLSPRLVREVLDVIRPFTLFMLCWGPMFSGIEIVSEAIDSISYCSF